MTRPAGVTPAVERVAGPAAIRRAGRPRDPGIDVAILTATIADLSSEKTAASASTASPQQRA